jgi:3-oxoacyl-[acyl-carrier protein] reductase
MNLNLAGKTVLITGGSRGLGFAIARRFAAEGCDLCLAARSRAALDDAADIIRRESTVKVNTICIDLGQRGSAQQVVQACADVDILVNNAGDISSGTLEDVDEERWRAGWDSKVFNYINLSREFFRRMKARRAGVIVNVIGISGDLLDATYIAGSVGNAAIAAFTRALGSTSHKFGIRVVGVNPGPCETERHERLARAKAMERHGDPERWRETFSAFPFARPASPDEIAAAVVFLASPLSAYTSGAILTIDGGLTGGREIAR